MKKLTPKEIKQTYDSLNGPVMTEQEIDGRKVLLPEYLPHNIIISRNHKVPHPFFMTAISFQRVKNWYSAVSYLFTDQSGMFFEGSEEYAKALASRDLTFVPFSNHTVGNIFRKRQMDQPVAMLIARSNDKVRYLFPFDPDLTQKQVNDYQSFQTLVELIDDCTRNLVTVTSKKRKDTPLITRKPFEVHTEFLDYSLQE